VYRGESFDKVKNTSILIAGLGALGSNLIETLVRQGYNNFKVVDKDRVEEQNLGTQVYNQRDIGVMKTTSILHYCWLIAKPNIEPFHQELTENNVKKFSKGVDLIVDCFDNSESRKILQDYARKSKTNLVHAGLYEDYGEVIWDESYRVPSNPVGGDICEYPLARNIIMLTVTVLSEVITRFLLESKKESYILTLKDFKISKQ
jgi:molybdopterin/thiamine biosynthesis adenylyltransferase